MLVRVFLTLAFALSLGAAADALVVSSPAFQEGAPLPASGAQPNCGGGTSQSPPLAWTGVPAGVTSFAVVLLDADGAGGTGFVHWVAYGIPATTTAIPAGFGSQASNYVAGSNSFGTGVFGGYCPPAGDTAHHYLFTVYATDLAPAALQPGLTRDALFAALRGHVKAAQSVFGRYGR
jgi:Raf kinase inhibitor-like YbhB/YbcL family protein